jgi:hypothetical protein
MRAGSNWQSLTGSAGVDASCPAGVWRAVFSSALAKAFYIEEK